MLSNVRKDCFLHKIYQLKDRQTDRGHVYFEILGLPDMKNHTSFSFFFFFYTKYKLVIETEFSFGKKAIFSGSAGKHSAWRRSWIPKGFSAMGFFPSNMSVHLTTSRHLHLETFILLL